MEDLTNRIQVKLAKALDLPSFKLINEEMVADPHLRLIALCNMLGAKGHEYEAPIFAVRYESKSALKLFLDQLNQIDEVLNYEIRVEGTVGQTVEFTELPEQCIVEVLVFVDDMPQDTSVEIVEPGTIQEKVKGKDADSDEKKDLEEDDEEDKKVDECDDNAINADDQIKTEETEDDKKDELKESKRRGYRNKMLAKRGASGFKIRVAYSSPKGMKFRKKV